MASIRAVALASILVAFASAASTAHAASSFTTCGFERWSVKTLQDRPVLRPPRLTTLRFLVTRPAPRATPTARLGFEHLAFTVVAGVVLVRPELDGDLHLVLRHGPLHLIAEAPAYGCTIKASPRLRQAMSAARSHVRLCARAKVTGVAFFDFKHGQTGVAPNGIELHPILGFHCLSG